MITARKVRELKGESLDESLRNYSDIRHFTIFDEYGFEMELTGYFENALDPFMSNIGGLGYKRNLTTFYLGTRQIVTDESIELDDLTGTINFYKNASNQSAYTQLNNFKLATELSSDLYIRYTIPFEQKESVVAFYPELTCKIKISSEDLGEINEENNLLELPIVMKRLTPWKSNIRQNDIIDNIVNNGTRTYVVDDSYTYKETEGEPKYGSKAIGETNLNIFGTSTTYPKITIYGPTTNPDILIIDALGNVAKHFAIQGNFNSSDVIVIDSDPENLSFTLNGTNNIYPQVRKGENYDTYLGLKPGKYTVKYSNELTDDIGKLVITYFWEYL